MVTEINRVNTVEPHTHESLTSGVSWAAVTAGAFVIAATYLILLALGAGMGLSTVSPWGAERWGIDGGFSAATPTIVWLILIELIASAVGGFLVGRLRTKWAQVHTDEVYFRDTANGFVAWAVALVLSVTFLISAAATMAGSGPLVQAASGATATETHLSAANTYYIDRLLRSDTNGIVPLNSPLPVEAGRILNNALHHDTISADDESYLSRLVSARAGISFTDAQQRVAATYADARRTQDTVRRETARLLLWLFISLLAGAFAASYAATIGGRQRDHVHAF